MDFNWFNIKRSAGLKTENLTTFGTGGMWERKKLLAHSKPWYRKNRNNYL